MKPNIELLAPAGSLKTMRYAFAYGADAVYAGAARYSLRMRGNEFNDDNLKTGIDEAHAQGKQFFLTVNTMPHNYKLQTAIRDLTPSLSAKPDAVIMSDPGLIMLVREAFPDLPIHLSVQANTVNWATVKFWQQNGISRVILSRELSLKEIAEIRERCPDIELEVFVHGALCIAYSGRCLLSGYFNNRDPNQGTCTNACRWQYSTHGAQEESDGSFIPTPDQIFSPDALQGITDSRERHPAADGVYFLEEKERPGEYMEISEDEHGTYIMNSRDLRAIEHVGELVRIGVDCLKIEGRTKSYYYAARTAQLYRQAIDDALAGREFNPILNDKLEGLANRGYTDGFFVRRQIKAQQNYANGSSNAATQQFVGEITSYDPASGRATIEAKNHFAIGDRLEVITPSGNREITLDQLWLAKNGEAIDAAKGSGWIVQADIGEIDQYALLARNL
ncbi:tRNA 5-hydroxyuridine modification protein YegQ [Cardiobacteriaceae bacterium TAE3-ERU3]|nr:tRNA 5-hydroxyuridine modification protein YegQ [Cardiobacteriaceae bacterium TAE3-ERU3]